MQSLCPHCLADLTMSWVDNDGATRNGFRYIGMEISGVYDGILFWECPDCKGRWHRFPEGHPYRYKADIYI
jgi:hypothetical protein